MSALGRTTARHRSDDSATDPHLDVPTRRQGILSGVSDGKRSVSESTPMRPRHAGGDAEESAEPPVSGRHGLPAEGLRSPNQPQPGAQSQPGAQPRPEDQVEAPRGDVAPIVVDGLSKQFGPVRAVDDLSFTVAPGRVTGFLGPNGAGKSTTLRMLLGLAEPTSGSATFGSFGYRDLPNPQQQVGAVLEPAFHPGRTGRDHLRVQAATAEARPGWIEELLELVGLTDAAARRVGGYSLGMRQRLALATALLGDPDYLILDEPGNGLDPEGIRWLRGFLKAFAARGRVVLMSSHILNEVEATVDDVVVIGNGRLLRQSPMADLAAERRSVRLRVADQAAAGGVLDRMGLRWQPVQDAHGPVLQVQTTDLAAIGGAIFEAGLPVLELAPTDVNLESEFFALLGGQQSDGPPPGPQPPAGPPAPGPAAERAGGSR